MLCTTWADVDLLGRQALHAVSSQSYCLSTRKNADHPEAKQVTANEQAEAEEQLRACQAAGMLKDIQVITHSTY